ncbi:MAG: helix-turn-helix transcriptional regulator [Pseudomonadota bacterium]
MSQELRQFALDVYDTVVDPGLWPDVFERFAQTIGAAGVVVFEMEGTGPERALTASHYSSGYDPELIEGYVRQFAAEEMAEQAAFARHSLAGDGINMIDDSVLMKSDDELFDQPNVRWMMQLGLKHRIGGLLNKDNVNISRIGIQLGAHRGRLTEAEKAKLGQIMPHIAKALELGRPAAQARRLQDSLFAVIDRLRVGVAILDGQGRVVTRNTEFNRQISEYDAFRIDPSGRLHLADGADEGRFAALTGDVLSHGSHGARPRKEAVAILRGDRVEALCIEIAPLARLEAAGSKPFQGHIVTSLDTSQALTCDAAALQQVFQLTDAETGLTQMMGEGLTNAQIADRRERSVDTVNAQVKSVLSKTQCANRTQLVRLLTSFGADLLVADRD